MNIRFSFEPSENDCLLLKHQNMYYVIYQLTHFFVVERLIMSENVCQNYFRKKSKNKTKAFFPITFLSRVSK